MIAAARVRCAAPRASAASRPPRLTRARRAWHTLLTGQSVINVPHVHTATADAGPRQRRKEARPQELLDAALALFVEKGFAATRAEEVAQRAGVSKGTLYLYYPSKEELFKAVVRQNLSQPDRRGRGARRRSSRAAAPSCCRC